MEIYKFVEPNEKNDYRFFNKELEENSLIFFHATPKRNVESIKNNGFRFGPKCQSVSYANNSSSCLVIRGHDATEDYAVFVVEFRTLDDKDIKINSSDIHVFSEDIQPTIKGYSVIPGDCVVK